MRVIMGAAALALLAGCATQGEIRTRRDVLFGFDRETLDAEAVETLSHLTDDVLEQGVASALVTGHTDTVGEAEFNQGLSERRALTVRRDLISRGVAPETIMIVGVGQQGLAVETPDETRARANRRVVIELGEFGVREPIDYDHPYAFALPPAAPQD